jgi:polar amino acid transport system substrate-binding protein
MIGQVTLQLLKASGCSAIGIDIDPAMRAKAIEMGADWAVLRSEPVEEIVKSMTGGHGLDAAILCAATDSNDPIELAGEIVRRKGRVVVVGTLPMDIPRRVYYPKELEVRFSTSYGPGRYDPDYEERGHDYPYAYVRFTEKRNMETALSLIGEGKIRMGPLISERFHIDQAVEAYARIENPSGEKPLGILFDYKIEQAKPRTAIRNPPSPGASSEQIGAPGVGLIGAGRFAAGVLIPKLKTVPGVQLWRVATARGSTANTAAKRFGFKHASCHAEEVYEDPAVGVVFIATRHRYHAEQLIAAVKAGKDVFVEKPLALDRKQLEKVVEGVSGSDRIILLGFNRRFAPMAKTAKDWFEPREWPLLMTARINAGRLDEDSWLLDPEEGGGRIVGEVCHVIDLFQYWTGSRVNRVAVEPARASKGVPKAEENLHISLGFEDGSAATLLYTSEGAGGLPKEAYEIHGGGRSAALHDWKRLDLYNGSRCRTVKSRTQDKGHGHAIGHFFDCVRKRKPPELSFSSCVRTTEVTFEIVERLRKGS